MAPSDMLMHSLLPASPGQAFAPQLGAVSVPATPAPLQAQLSPRFSPAALLATEQAPPEAQQLTQNAAQLQAQAENLKVCPAWRCLLLALCVNSCFSPAQQPFWRLNRRSQKPSS